MIWAAPLLPAGVPGPSALSLRDSGKWKYCGSVLLRPQRPAGSSPTSQPFPPLPFPGTVAGWSPQPLQSPADGAPSHSSNPSTQSEPGQGSHRGKQTTKAKMLKSILKSGSFQKSRRQAGKEFFPQ